MRYTLFQLSSPRFETGSSRRNGTRILQIFVVLASDIGVLHYVIAACAAASLL